MVFTAVVYRVIKRQPKISVVVVNYKSGPLLERCLKSLQQQTWRDFEVLLVDNSSGESAVPSLYKSKYGIRLIAPGRNLGFSAGINLGVSQAHGDWIATLNPDAFPATDWLEALVDASRRHPGFTLFASAQFDYEFPETLDGAGDHYSPLGFAWRGGKGMTQRFLPAEGRTFGPCAAAAFYRKDAYLAIGGFDNAFFCYYEDVDFAFRMLLAGHGCLFVRNACVHHIGSAITGAASPFSVYHITRNRLWTFVKNMPGPLFVVLAIPTLLVLLQSLFKVHRSERVRGMIDAFRALPAMMSKRRKIQAQRSISWFEVASALTWAPMKMLHKAPDVRAMPPAQPLGDERVCAVIVTYLPQTSIKANLDAILAQVDHVVVVDNGSDAGTQELLTNMVGEAGGHLEVLFNESNIGLGRAQNMGIRLALSHGYPWLLLMDDDSSPAPEMVKSLMASYSELPRYRPIGLLAPHLERQGTQQAQSYFVARNRWHIARREHDEEPVLTELVFAISSGSLIPATVFERIGLMREEFFIDYLDVEFCLRLREAGYTIVSVNSARMKHCVGRTEERSLAGRRLLVTHHPDWRRYYIFRNRAYLWRTRCYTWPVWVASDIAAAMLDVVRILRFETKRRRKLYMALTGVWDGMRKCLAESVRGSR